jgi:hypothetical protein
MHHTLINLLLFLMRGGVGAPPVPLARNVTLTFRPQRTAAPVFTSRTVTVTFGAV